MSIITFVGGVHRLATIHTSETDDRQTDATLYISATVLSAKNNSTVS